MNLPADSVTMSKRDYIATLIVQSLVASPTSLSKQDAVATAVEIADLLLEQLHKKQPKYL